MRRVNKIICTVMTLMYLVIICPIPVLATGNSIDIEAKSGLLMEPTSGKILYEKNIHEKFAPASVTKIMTMLLAMEAIDSGKIKLSDKITVSENAKNMGGSTMLLDTGEIRTVEEILKGIGIASGNDAAVTMGEYLAGTEDAFVKRMNERAQELGMKDTNFVNCTGLTADGHVTSAYDIALMSRELLKHPTILNYTSIYMETISEGRKTPIELVNHNKLVRFFKGCDGLKTGYTNEAKYCISATALRDNVRMLSVIMGAPTYKIRNRDASMLMNYGFSQFESKILAKKDESIEKINLNKQGSKYFEAVIKEDVNIVFEKGKEVNIEKKCAVNLDKKSYKKDDEVGICEIYVNEELYTTVKIYSDRDFKKGNLLDNFKYNLSRLFDFSI